jgi:hypothetical protein
VMHDAVRHVSLLSRVEQTPRGNYLSRTVTALASPA